MTDIQFGVCFWGIESPQEISRFVRRADELGYDVLAAAAVLSERLRQRTYVLNGAFWQATLLAREIATLDLSSARVADRVAAVRRAADGRAYRSDIVLQTVVIDKDPEESAAELAARRPDESPELILDAPALLLARDARHAAAELRRRHTEFGFDSVTVHGARIEEFGEVIAAYRAGD